MFWSGVVAPHVGIKSVVVVAEVRSVATGALTVQVVLLRGWVSQARTAVGFLARTREKFVRFRTRVR